MKILRVCFLRLKVFAKLWINVQKIMNVWLYQIMPKSNKLDEQIFWYKAAAHGEFKLGSKEFWEISKNLGSDDEEDDYDPNAFKKRGPTINVKKNKW